MDVVRAEVIAMGGRIETATAAGQGTSFKLVLPLTTAVTQVVMLRCGESTVAVPSTLVEIVRRATPAEIDAAYASGAYEFGDSTLPFFWLGACSSSARARARRRAGCAPSSSSAAPSSGSPSTSTKSSATRKSSSRTSARSCRACPASPA
jgi:chemotaxis protein histidine kinase CheA